MNDLMAFGILLQLFGICLALLAIYGKISEFVEMKDAKSEKQ